jgi:hypothetical protein
MSDKMGEIYNRKDLKIARELGIDDIISFVNQEKLDSISEGDAVLLAKELLNKRGKIFGYANNLITPLPV